MSFLLSFLIAITYQYKLNDKTFENYILSDLQNNQDITSLIDLNKEGIFSTFGYLSIYIAGEGMCHRLKEILKAK